MPPRQVKGPVYPEHSELAAALASCRGAFIGIGLVSGLSNVLMLTGAMFMLEIYDRVLPSRSVPTLIGIAILAGGLYVAQGLIDLIRGRLLVRIGSALDEAVSGRVFDTILRLPMKVARVSDGLQPLRDLDSVRSFLSGLGPIALFDLPWLPFYIGICYLLHPWLGYTALGGAIILVALTLLTEMLTRRPTKAAASFAASRSELAQAGHRNAEAIVAMGMVGRMVRRWAEANRHYMAGQWSASDVVGGLGAVSKVLRFVLQSAMLGVGAFLVIHQEATAGIIIAGSILAARALAPVDLAIANWKAFAACRQSWQRLNKLLALLPPQQMPMLLPAPRERLTVESASATPPGSSKLVLQDISFKLERGSGLGVIGPTGSGKSSLARLLVGVWQPARGKVRLDGCTFDQWSSEVLGAHIGYLPQDVELLSGTVAQNIARFEPDADPQAIVAAAKAAGVHELIIELSEGYESHVGERGETLSAGQAQRIALARALYRDPFLIVLDEPNSNLDAAGDEALTRAILGIRARGGIVVVIAHRPSAIAGVDLLLVLKQGRLQAFGPKDEILSKVLQRDTPAPRPLKVVSDMGGSASS
ncbi:MAG: type I secretion system permease/ATPase [Hyphomicrobiales bacterium]|jgi:PrtD family type I secretion system ABC transporter|nr:type I secretion system permease/ATPase [Hyphomicrobiales bacterium]